MPDLTLQQAWTFAAGGDLAGTAVFWFTPTFGMQASARVGAGPSWVGFAEAGLTPALWTHGTIGLAF